MSQQKFEFSNPHKKYLAVISEGPEALLSFDTFEETEEYVTRFLMDNPGIDEVAIYELHQLGKRRPSVQWVVEKPVPTPPVNGGPYKPWTLEENSFLISSKQAGYAYQDIAEHLGRTTHAVEVQASRLRCG